MMKTARLILPLGLMMTLAACSPENPSLEAPVQAPDTPMASVKPIPVAAVYTPKVDILFVIDHSASMDKHQENLKKNINRFVEAFDKKANIDFRIGMVTVHDSARTLPASPNFWPNGLLRPLKGPDGQSIDGDAFVNGEEGYAEILGETLKFGTLSLANGGPEIEEVFSPIKAALNSSLNPGFLRRDAHLAVIMVTDADDSSAEIQTISADQLYQAMLTAKGGDAKLISTYGALVYGPQVSLADGRPDPNCKVDPGLVNKTTGKAMDPEKIQEFIAISNGPAYDRARHENRMHLCDPNFGERLANVGQKIVDQASAHVRLPLPYVPQYGLNADGSEKLVVRIAGGGRDLEPGVEWKYDTPRRRPTILLLNADKIPELANGGSIEIEMIPVDFRRVVTGEGRRYGN